MVTVWPPQPEYIWYLTPYSKSLLSPGLEHQLIIHLGIEIRDKASCSCLHSTDWKSNALGCHFPNVT